MSHFSSFEKRKLNEVRKFIYEQNGKLRVIGYIPP